MRLLNFVAWGQPLLAGAAGSLDCGSLLPLSAKQPAVWLDAGVRATNPATDPPSTGTSERLAIYVEVRMLCDLTQALVPR